MMFCSWGRPLMEMVAEMMALPLPRSWREFKAWMKSYALPEHLLQWPLLLCPLMATVQAGLGMLFGIMI